MCHQTAATSWSWGRWIRPEFTRRDFKCCSIVHCYCCPLLLVGDWIGILSVLSCLECSIRPQNKCSVIHLSYWNSCFVICVSCYLRHRVGVTWTCNLMFIYTAFETVSLSRVIALLKILEWQDFLIPFALCAAPSCSSESLQRGQARIESFVSSDFCTFSTNLY